MSTETHTNTPLMCDEPIRAAVDAMEDGPLLEDGLKARIAPLFSRTLKRNARTDEIYLANHSLGRPLDAIQHVVTASLDAWYTDLDGAWAHWIGLRERYRAEMARLIGAQRPDSVVPKTSAAQGLRAVINALPSATPNIITTRAEFDSIDFVLKALRHKGHAAVTHTPVDDAGLVDEQALIDAIDGGTDLVVCSLVCFVTGQVLQRVGEVVDAAHEHGAIVLLDTYHAAGAMPLSDDARRADFMIGGNYKYTRGGAGACWLWINDRHLHDAPRVPDQDELFTTDTGWFAKHEPFAFERRDDPLYAAGGDAWLEATPPVLTYAQALPGLVLSNTIGVGRIRDYTLVQMDRLTSYLGEHGLTAATPEHHGSYVLVYVDEPRGAVNATLEQGVNADARPSPSGRGGYLRLCPDLLTTDEELREAARRVAQALG